MRGYHLGGRSLTWDRATFRLSPTNFNEPGQDGHGSAWSISYDDIAPWYSHVERFIGVTGQCDGLDILPDGEFLPPMPLNCVEEHAKSVIEATALPLLRPLLQWMLDRQLFQFQRRQLARSGGDRSPDHHHRRDRGGHRL